MPSHELTPQSSAASSPCSSSTFFCNFDEELAEQSSNDMVTMPSCFEHFLRKASVLDMVQNVELLEAISICLQLLETAIHPLRELQRALDIKPVEIPEKYSTQTVSGAKEYIAPLEYKIVENLLLDIDIICPLPIGFTDRFGTKDPSIHEMIFGEDRLLETMRKLRIHCQDSRHVQWLPATLRYAAATMYVMIFDCCNELVSPRDWRYQKYLGSSCIENTESQYRNIQQLSRSIVVLLPESDLCTSPNRQVQNNRNLRWASVQQ